MRRLLTVSMSRIGAGAMVATLVMAAPAMAEVRAGGVGAINLASLTTDEPNTKFGTLPRWGVGGVLEVDLTENLAIATRPMFVRRGADIEKMPGLDVAAQGKGAYARVEIDSIEIPLLLKYSAPVGRVRPYLLAGPSLGLRQGAEAVRKFGTAAEEREDIEDDFKKADFGLCAGMGVGADVGRAHLFAEGLYTLGLTNINDDKTETAHAKHRGVQFRVGVALRLGGR